MSAIENVQFVHTDQSILKAECAGSLKQMQLFMNAKAQFFNDSKFFYSNFMSLVGT